MNGTSRSSPFRRAAWAFLIASALAFSLGIAIPLLPGQSVPQNVQKGGSAGLNNITADLNIGSGRTLGIAAGGALNVDGTLSGAPTGGELDLSDVSLSLPSFSVEDGFTVTSAGSIALTAGGTDENITLTPSGTGAVSVGSAGLRVGTDTTSTWHLNVFADGGAGVPPWERNITSRLIGTLTADSATSYRGLDVFANLKTGGFNSTGSLRGLTAAASTSGSSGGSFSDVRGADISATSAGGSANVAVLSGVVSTLVLQGSGTATDGYGIRSSSLRTGGASLTNYYAFAANAPATSVGTTIAAAYYAPWDAASGRWGLYLPGTVANHLGGELLIGSTTDAGNYALQVTGDTSLTGDLAVNGGDITSTGGLTLTPTSGPITLHGGSEGVRLANTDTAGLQLYNTADQTTNYERLGINWANDSALIQTTVGGSSTRRSITMRSASGTLNIQTVGATFNAGAQGTNIATLLPLSNTSGTSVIASITPAYNQASGTASNTDLLINRTETAVGSGEQKLIDAQVGGVSRFSVSNLGTLTIATPAGAAASGLTVASNRNASVNSSIYNTNTGTGAASQFIVGQNPTAGAQGVSLRVNSIGFTSSGIDLQDGGSLLTGTEIGGGLVIGTRADAPVIFAQNNSEVGRFTINGGLLFFREVQAVDSSASEAAANSNILTTNEGATGMVTRTLPNAVAGLTFTYYVQDADGITITAAAGDTIRIAGNVTADGGSISATTVGNSVTLGAINATEWVATSVVGTWSF